MNPYLQQAKPCLGFGLASMECSLLREQLVGKYAFAIPNAGAIAAIAAYSPLLEVGAGSGYWASLLAAAGADIVATDLKPGEKNPYQQRQLYYPVEALEACEAIARYPGRALLTIWPDYNALWTGIMLGRYLEQGGHTVCYVGESEYGCTGDDVFHAHLDHLTGLACVEIPQWPGVHDALWIYQVPGW